MEQIIKKYNLDKNKNKLENVHNKTELRTNPQLKKDTYKNNDLKYKQDHIDVNFSDIVIKSKRVTKVTKGGRKFRFSSVVVIGDKKGHVGIGSGKAREKPESIKKAIKDAKKTLIKIPISITTVPHKIIGNFGASSVMIKPAKKGVGIIAGKHIGAVIELSGILDVYTKPLGSNTPINMVRATLNGLNLLRTSYQVNKLRGKID